MIVIAAHTDQFYPALVEDILNFTPKEKFKVIKSEDNGGGYCIKSYLDGIDSSEEFMFMHDSIRLKDEMWLNRFRDKYNGGIVAHSTFGTFYDNSEQQSYAQGIVPDGQISVFGPIFYTKKDIADRLKPYFAKHTPSNVNQLRAWERILGSICTHEDITINSVYGEYNQPALENDTLPGMTKLFPQRL